jgi:hypothetical protein
LKLVPLDRERFAGKGWRRPRGWTFAATEALVPVVGVEFARAATTMPIAFVQRSNRYVPVVITSPANGRNLYVSPDGQWLGTYVPAVLRGYPFALVPSKGTDKLTLCIDEDSGLIANADDTTEKFFETDGSASAALKSVLDLLQHIERNRVATAVAIAALAEAQLFEQWPLTVKIGEQPVATQGLHRLDQAKLNALDDAAFLKLRKPLALVLAYAHLLSLQNAERFGALAALQQQLAPPPMPPVSSLFSGDDSGTIRFD